MSEKSNEIIASNLTIAFYSGQEKRQPFLGEDRRRNQEMPEGQRNFRQGTITPGEVYEVFERFLAELDKRDGE